MTKREQKKWLAKQPDEITAYKIVEVRPRCKDKKKRQRLYPAFYGNTPYNKKKENRIKREKKKVLTWGGHTNKEYRPYYHFFIDPVKAKEMVLRGWFEKQIVICEIKKEDITTIGTQYCTIIIVAKAFKITGAKLTIKSIFNRGSRTCV
jgi:hypothetical protein